MPENGRVHLIVKGVVQGVGYRYFVVQVARGYGLTGFVRNREDGSVEVEAQGDATILQSFINDLKIGPRAAEVSAIDVRSLPPENKYRDFDVHV